MKTRSWMPIAGVSVFLLVVLIASSIVIIPAGEIGVITQFGATTGRTVEQGLSFKIPFIQNVNKMSIKTQIYSADSLTAASKDLQDVTTNIAINYKLNENEAVNVYKTIGNNYMEIIAQPAIQEVVKEIMAKYNAEECITKRSEVKGAISTSLVDRLGERGITVESVNITNF